MSNKKFFCTTMYRLSDRESYSYVVYVGASGKRAKEIGLEVMVDRGNKYYPEVVGYKEEKIVE